MIKNKLSLIISLDTKSCQRFGALINNKENKELNVILYNSKDEKNLKKQIISQIFPTIHYLNFSKFYILLSAGISPNLITNEKK